MLQQYPSRLLEQAVLEFSRLPGIGRKTALRLVLHLLRQETADVVRFADSVATMRREVKFCHVCHNISDTDICPICADTRRDASVICVVENIQDVMAIENTQSIVSGAGRGGCWGYWDNWGYWGCWGCRGCWGCWDNWGFWGYWDNWGFWGYWDNWGFG